MDIENQYRFKFYLNARHFIRIDGVDTEIHPHTWEIGLYVVKKEEVETRFKEVEEAVEHFFSRYDNKLLNEIPPFHILPPTTENMGKIFYKELSERLKKELSLSLNKLEISENPTRTYIVNQYESYVQDIRKEVEKEILRFKEKHKNNPLSAEPIAEEKRRETEKAFSSENQKEEKYTLQTPLSSRKPKSFKRTIFQKGKIITGIVAIIAVMFLTYYRTL